MKNGEIGYRLKAEGKKKKGKKAKKDLGLRRCSQNFVIESSGDCVIENKTRMTQWLDDQ